MRSPQDFTTIQLKPPAKTPNPNLVSNPNSNHKLSIPEVKPYLISSSTKRLLTAVDSLSEEGRNINILVTGSQGIGKSELVTQYAATRNRHLATLEIGNLAESSQIFGFRDLKAGAVTFIKGLFTEAITTPYTVVHLQEINRPENDKALNALFSVLDDTFRQIWLDELQASIQVAKGVTFFASLNEGFEFIGTLPLDEALKNRFHIKLNLPQLPPHVEKTIILLRTGIQDQKADDIIDMATRLRDNSQDPVYISTRDMVNIATLVVAGLNNVDAVRAVIGTGADKLESILLSEHLAGRGSTLQEELYELL